MKSPLSLYLERYAEPEHRISEAWRSHSLAPVDHAVVVPLLGEASLAQELWESLDAAGRHRGESVLAIAVVNATPDHPDWVHEANRATLAAWGENGGPRLSASPPAWLYPFSPSLQILVLDRARSPWQMASREGVGHARKIGCDAALGLYADGFVRSRYLSTTDADARVALDYFEIPEAPDPKALGLGPIEDFSLVHPFRHLVEAGQSRPLLLYEISLRYYVLGLRAAGSPYAFHTIGSTLSFSAEAYAQVRGFPRREAAEDFYFLDKLAKHGRIRTAGGEVRLVARPSNRVPFGTGRSMQNIDEKLAGGEPFRLYHPEVFPWVGRWLRAASDFARHGELERVREQLQGEERVVPLLENLGAFTCLERAWRDRRTESDRRRHILTWFDGLKTLQFIHALRDNGLPSLEWRTALTQAHFLEHPPANSESDTEWLRWIRERDRGE